MIYYRRITPNDKVLDKTGQEVIAYAISRREFFVFDDNDRFVKAYENPSSANAACSQVNADGRAYYFCTDGVIRQEGW